jgi:hypothetical protein
MGGTYGTHEKVHVRKIRCGVWAALKWLRKGPMTGWYEHCYMKGIECIV